MTNGNVYYILVYAKYIFTANMYTGGFLFLWGAFKMSISKSVGLIYFSIWYAEYTE